MKSNPTTFGNLTIRAREDGIVELTLNTEVRGRAHCMFTHDSIGQLCHLLQSAGSKVAPAEDEDDDLLDMV